VITTLSSSFSSFCFPPICSSTSSLFCFFLSTFGPSPSFFCCAFLLSLQNPDIDPHRRPLPPLSPSSARVYRPSLHKPLLLFPHDIVVFFIFFFPSHGALTVSGISGAYVRHFHKMPQNARPVKKITAQHREYVAGARSRFPLPAAAEDVAPPAARLRRRRAPKDSVPRRSSAALILSKSTPTCLAAPTPVHVHFMRAAVAMAS